MANKNIVASTTSCSPRPKYWGSVSRRQSSKILERVIDYVMGNLIAVITAVGLFIGGLILLVYLWSESYFPPDINASSIGLLFAAAAIIGIGITLAFCMYFIVPGFIYRHILAEELKEESIDLLSDRAIKGSLDLPAFAVSATFFIWLTIDPKSTISFFWGGCSAF